MKGVERATSVKRREQAPRPKKVWTAACASYSLSKRPLRQAEKSAMEGAAFRRFHAEAGVLLPAFAPEASDGNACSSRDGREAGVFGARLPGMKKRGVKWVFRFERRRGRRRRSSATRRLHGGRSIVTE
jgi:hypothetical protein